MNAHIRIERAPSSQPGGKRLTMHGRVVAVGDDGTEVDISSIVGLSKVIFKAGDIELVELTVMAFEIESPSELVR